MPWAQQVVWPWPRAACLLGELVRLIQPLKEVPGLIQPLLLELRPHRVPWPSVGLWALLSAVMLAVDYHAAPIF